MMEHLPPVGWADVATKSDLDHLAALIRGELEATKNELLATFRAEQNTQTRSMIQAMIFATSASTVTVAALAFAAARLV